jgi:hypothetical protein
MALSREELWRVFKRVVCEFGPPILGGLIWLAAKWEPNVQSTDRIAQFSFAFFIASWVWGNLLRIQHQQTQKHQTTGLTTNLVSMRSTMSALEAAIAAAVPGVTLTREGGETIVSKMTKEQFAMVENAILDSVKQSDEAFLRVGAIEMRKAGGKITLRNYI